MRLSWIVAGSMLVSGAFAMPARALSSSENCSAKAAILVIALKNSFHWQLYAQEKGEPEPTEAEFLKSCEELPSSSTQIAEALEQTLTSINVSKREIASLTALPKKVRDAFVVAEDPEFYQRPRADFSECVGRLILFSNIALARVMTRGSIDASDSTKLCYSRFSRTLARSLILTQLGLQSTIKRELTEMLWQERLEALLDKDALLETYLNHMYFGRGARGVAEAARRYYDKKPSELAVEEAAYLAALVKAPTYYSDPKNSQKAQERRNWVLSEMAARGFIPSGEAEAAAARPLTVVERHGFRGLSR
ncbi:transglycosylase domain-containing protein [Rhodomicrobium vannielii ATCC 17100]|nr:transglycosylase domain-containing protein [Rhodomicrobium vannielii ATCC 17100]